MTNFHPQVQQKLAKFVLLQTLNQKLVPTRNPTCFQLCCQIYVAGNSGSLFPQNKKKEKWWFSLWLTVCLFYNCNCVSESQLRSSQFIISKIFISSNFYKFYFSLVRLFLMIVYFLFVKFVTITTLFLVNVSFSHNCFISNNCN